ncbi:MAG: hypothetical protein LBD23_19285 [Oscillospiraceae bacterium]|jgi:uncharacterized membrane protein YhdT|nr:hypothetical protein [Oscillospiraceae bacterium]
MVFMRLSAFVMPIFAILAGIGGYYLRLSEHLNVFDLKTGLPERNAATSFWLVALTVTFLIFILIFSANVAARHKAIPGFESAFGTDPFSYPIIFILIGIAWLVGTYMHFSDLGSMGPLSSVDIVFIALSALSAISVTLFAIEMYQDSRRKAPYALSIIPTIFMCFWLIMLYRQNASNPVLLGYVYQCLAVTATALSLYYTSGFLYSKPSPGKAIFMYYIAIYFCTVTLADGYSMGINLVFYAIITTNIVYSSMLLKNLQEK